MDKIVAAYMNRNLSKEGIRPYRKSDANHLIAIDQKSYKYPFNDASSYESAHTIVYADHDDKPIGYAMTFDSKLPERQKSKYVYSIAVHPDHRGKNISDKLIDGIQESGFPTELHVRVGNKNAINLYKKHGFVISSTIDGHYADGESAHHMIKE